MIRSMITLAAIASLTGVAATAQVAPAPDAVIASVAIDSVQGTIGSIDTEGGSFTIKAGERTQTVKIDENTTYYKDGRASTRDQVLKVGSDVTVTHTDGTATRVEAMSEKQ
jgi:hypothetical protein